MSKNLIPEIARMLGVAIGEEFKVKGYELTYMITDDKGLMATNDSPETGWNPANAANALFVALLNGKYEIVKLPWKPKKKERYWTFNVFFESGKWVTTSFVWGDEVFDNAVFKVGWVYRTREEAEAALPAVAAEMGVQYVLKKKKEHLNA